MKKKNVVNENGGAQIAAPRKKGKMGRIVIAVIAIILIVLWLVSRAMPTQSVALVTTTSVTRGELQESISTSGTVTSEESKVFFAPVNGTVATVNVAAGDAVKAGDILVSYDMDAMERSMQQARLQQSRSSATYKSALANNNENQAKLAEANLNLSVLEQQIADHTAYLKKLQEQLDQNQRDTSNSLAEASMNINNRISVLRNELAALTAGTPEYDQKNAQLQAAEVEASRNSYLQGVANSSDYVAKTQKEIADTQEKIKDFEEYKARMESQKTSSESAVMDTYDKQQYEADNEIALLSYQQSEEEYYRAKTGVVADFDGIVTECTVLEGATVTQGTQLFTLQSSNEVKVTFNASNYDIEKLALGQKADITISGNTYEGSVSKINRMAIKNASNTPMVGVEIHIDNPDENIILGLDARLTIYTQKADNALLIPVEAINADRGGDFVYVAENGVAVRKSIVCGVSSDLYTEVVEGLEETDQVIVTAFTELTEGMAVTAMPQQ